MTFADRLQPDEPERALALRPTQGESAVLRPAGSLTELVESFRQYVAVVDALLTADDYQTISGRRFKKKSAWRKLATAFNISTSVVEHGHDADANLYWFVIRATAPNGRCAEAWGGCSQGERNFSHPQDVRAQAQTRATSRAIADLIGAGEVSAEEMAEETPAAPASRLRKATRKAQEPEPSPYTTARAGARRHPLMQDQGLHPAEPQAEDEPPPAEPTVREFLHQWKALGGTWTGLGAAMGVNPQELRDSPPEHLQTYAENGESLRALLEEARPPERRITP